MMSAVKILLISSAFALVSTACAPVDSSGGAAVQQQAQLTGEASYMQRIALPKDAVMTVAIEDVSRADAPSIVIAQSVVQTNGRQVPLPFTIDFDPAKIEDKRTYSVRASIRTSDGELLWTTDEHVPFKLATARQPLSLKLVQVGADSGEQVPPMVEPKLPDSNWLAVGNEPGWRIELKEDGVFSYLGDYGETQFTAASGKVKLLPNDVREWQVKHDGKSLTLRLTNTACQDDMAGTAYPMTAELMIDGKRLRGCGRPVNQGS